MTWLGWILVFCAGFVCGVATWTLWLALRFTSELKAASQSVGDYLEHVDSRKEVHQSAARAVEACKNRLRWHRNPNPEWIPPLLDEIPRLVKEIAAIYYPAAEQPLLAPGLSQFTRAVHLAAMDITDFLHNRAIGRLVDVSANTAYKAWEQANRLAKHDTVKELGKWYRRVLPVWQVLRFKSPVVWASLAVSNVATRTLQHGLII